MVMVPIEEAADLKNEALHIKDLPVAVAALWFSFYYAGIIHRHTTKRTILINNILNVIYRNRKHWNAVNIRDRRCEPMVSFLHRFGIFTPQNDVILHHFPIYRFLKSIESIVLNWHENCIVTR